MCCILSASFNTKIHIKLVDIEIEHYKIGFYNNHLENSVLLIPIQFVTTITFVARFV